MFSQKRKKKQRKSQVALPLPPEALASGEKCREVIVWVSLVYSRKKKSRTQSQVDLKKVLSGDEVRSFESVMKSLEKKAEMSHEVKKALVLSFP